MFLFLILRMPLSPLQIEFLLLLLSVTATHTVSYCITYFASFTNKPCFSSSHHHHTCYPTAKNFVVLSFAINVDTSIYISLILINVHTFQFIKQKGKGKPLKKPFRGKIVGTMQPIYFRISVPSCIPFVEINFQFHSTLLFIVHLSSFLFLESGYVDLIYMHSEKVRMEIENIFGQT